MTWLTASAICGDVAVLELQADALAELLLALLRLPCLAPGAARQRASWLRAADPEE